MYEKEVDLQKQVVKDPTKHIFFNELEQIFKVFKDVFNDKCVNSSNLSTG